jgi:hypothetical protein
MGTKRRAKGLAMILQSFLSFRSASASSLDLNIPWLTETPTTEAERKAARTVFSIEFAVIPSSSGVKTVMRGKTTRPVTSPLREAKNTRMATRRIAPRVKGLKRSAAISTAVRYRKMPIAVADPLVTSHGE